MMMIRRVPELAVASASVAACSASRSVSAISSSPAFSKVVSAFSSSSVKIAREPSRSSAFWTRLRARGGDRALHRVDERGPGLGVGGVLRLGLGAGEQLLELGRVDLVRLDVGLRAPSATLSWAGEVAVETYRCCAVRLMLSLARSLDGAERLGGLEVLVGELLDVVAHAVHGVHAGEGDDRQRQAECTEGASKPRGERKIADGGHACGCRPADRRFEGHVKFS